MQVTSPRGIVLLTLRGEVQGVGMRAWLKGEAQARGVEGWVRNRGDGSVEAALAGTPDAVGALVELCRGNGGVGRIDGIEVVARAEGQSPAPFARGVFEILPTA